MSDRVVKLISETKLIDLLGATNPKDIRRVKTAVRKHNLTAILKSLVEKPEENYETRNEMLHKLVDLLPKQMICEQKDCGKQIHNKYYKIWNGKNGAEPSIYCPSCGKKIASRTYGLFFDFVDKDISNASGSENS